MSKKCKVLTSYYTEGLIDRINLDPLEFKTIKGAQAFVKSMKSSSDKYQFEIVREV